MLGILITAVVLVTVWAVVLLVSGSGRSEGE